MPVLYSLGNFIMDETIVGRANSGLPSGLATQWTMSSEALIAVLEITNGELASLYIFPILLNADGFPARADTTIGEKMLRDIETFPPGPIDWKKVHDAALLQFQ